MKLVASLVIRNELGRYLEQCLGHLLEFCDEVVVLDDGSADLWQIELRYAFGDDSKRLLTSHNEASSFYEHEGRLRQALLDLTLSRDPTHILAVDADEFVADGETVRRACTDTRPVAWTLCMQEVWNAHPDRLELRQDGGWREYDATVLWRPDRLARPRIRDAKLAGGRVPENLPPRALRGCVESPLLHFGWANRGDRWARYDRYTVADGGRFHSSAHLDSILAPDERVSLNQVEWPAALLPRREAILARTGAV